MSELGVKGRSLAGLVRICEAGAVAPGSMHAVEIEGLPAMAVFNVEGRIYVTSNICTHSFAYLTEGYFEGKTVECPLHSGKFDVTTGEATDFPCTEPLHVYEVVIENGDVYVRLPGGRGAAI